MVILYLHGKDSSIERTGREKLLWDSFPQYDIIAEDISYDDRFALVDYFKMIQNNEIDIIIGSSYGAYIGEYLTRIPNDTVKKYLGFNPPLYRNDLEIRSRYVDAPKPLSTFSNDVIYNFHLGIYDSVVRPDKVFPEIRRRSNVFSNVNIKIIGASHRIPDQQFKDSLKVLK